MDQNNTFDRITYMGTVFLAECKEHYFRMEGPLARNYIIRGIADHGDLVVFPEEIEGVRVTSFAPGDESWPGIRRVVYSRYLGKLPPGGTTFPDLEEVEIDEKNEIFRTDGHLIFEDSGKTLFSAAGAVTVTDTVTVPACILRIGAYAFRGTKCKEIVFENPDVIVDRTSFLDSVWRHIQGRVVYIGDTVTEIKPPVRTIHNRTYPPVQQPDEPVVLRESTKRICCFALKDSGCDELTGPPQPSLWKDLEGIRSVTIYGDSDQMSEVFRALSFMTDLQEIHLRGNTRYTEQDGIIYTADSGIAVFTPCTVTSWKRVIVSGEDPSSLDAKFRAAVSICRDNCRDGIIISITDMHGQRMADVFLPSLLFTEYQPPGGPVSGILPAAMTAQLQNLYTNGSLSFNSYDEWILTSLPQRLMPIAAACAATRQAALGTLPDPYIECLRSRFKECFEILTGSPVTAQDNICRLIRHHALSREQLDQILTYCHERSWHQAVAYSMMALNNNLSNLSINGIV